MKLFNMVFFVIAVCSFGFSATKESVWDEKPVKSVKIGKLLWTAEDAGNATLFSEIDLTNACPVGWHVARAEDWENLFRTIGADQKCGSFGYDGEPDDACDYSVWKKAGLYLKSTSFKGKDKYGFSVFPNGDAFGQKGFQATYWALGINDLNWVCFTEEDDAWDYCGQDSNGKYLVRCVKD